jgi:polyphosphate kinase
MKKQFLGLIDKEIAFAKQGKSAWITAKMNSLVDVDVILKLYEASNAGVQIKLIIRGICCLVPGIKNSSENIQVISIIDRFLEHARVYVFGNNGNEKVYLASADWMTRNLSNRIECGFPIYSAKNKQIIKDILQIQLSDNCKARIMNGIDDSINYNPSYDLKIRAQYDTYSYLEKSYPF